MPKFQDISPAFSLNSLKFLADALMLSASQNQSLTQPSHLIKALQTQASIKPILSKLNLSSLEPTPSKKPITLSQSTVKKVNLSPTSKKVLYEAYAQMLSFSHQKVEPFHFLPPLNAYLQKPIDKTKLSQILKTITPSSQSSASPASTLEQFSQNLNSKAQSGQLDPVIGREQEIDQLIRILARRTKSNAILLGEPGVGKTAIVEGLALKIVQKQVPDLLKPVSIYSLNLTDLLAGTSYQGELEERLQNLVKEVKKQGNLILFIDEVHLIIGAGQAAGSMTAANILKPALARGDLNVIGATTQDEYRQYIEKDPALERRFEPVKVSEPTSEKTLEILKSVAQKLKDHHGISLQEPVLKAAIDLTVRYIHNRYLPDKAIDLLDEATSGAKIAGKNQVTEEDLKKVLSQRTGIPITSLTQEESIKLMDLENQLKSQIIGQDHAVKAVADVIKRSRAGLKDPHRPIGSFLLLGPTGVGKTETAKALARTVYQSESAMIRLDMSEFTESHTADKLIGAPPGYVGYEEGGQLTNPVRQKPYSLILLDELEKAHPKVFDIFLQVLEDGRLTDSQGHTADFKNTIIIMTSNISLPDIQGPTLKESSDQTVGADKSERSEEGSDLNGKTSSDPSNRTQLMKALTHYLRPEFLNRIDDIILMNKLKLEDIKKIARLQLNQLQKRLQSQNITLKVPDETLNKLADLGNVAEFGARPLKRLIQNHIEEPIAEMMINNQIKSGDTVTWTPEKI